MELVSELGRIQGDIAVRQEFVVLTKSHLLRYCMTSVQISLMGTQSNSIIFSAATTSDVGKADVNRNRFLLDYLRELCMEME